MSASRLVQAWRSVSKVRVSRAALQSAAGAVAERQCANVRNDALFDMRQCQERVYCMCSFTRLPGCAG